MTLASFGSTEMQVFFTHVECSKSHMTQPPENTYMNNEE